MIQVKMNIPQARVLMNACELYGRIGMGQLHDLERHPALEARRYAMEEAEILLDQLKTDLFPLLAGRGHSYGIRNENTVEASKIAYDVHQVVRHALAWHNQPDKVAPWANVSFDEPTQFSLEPLPAISIQGNPEASIFLSLNDNQIRVWLYALEFYARFGMGYVNELVSHPAFNDKQINEPIFNRLTQFKQTVFGHTRFYKIQDPETPERSKIAYDLTQSVRYFLACLENPNHQKWEVTFDSLEAVSKEPLAICQSLSAQ